MNLEKLKKLLKKSKKGILEKYGEFFKYRKQWKPSGKKAKINFRTIWNNYDLIKKKILIKINFLTNNISKSINHILNSYNMENIKLLTNGELQ